MIIKDLSNRKKEIINILIKVFQEYWPEASDLWFEEQIKDVNMEISLGYIKDDKLIAIYLLKDESCYTLQGKGIHGEALAVLPEYRGQKISEQFFQYIKENYQYNYLWGTASKKLNNLDFWLQYRHLFAEDHERYYTVQYLQKI